MFLWLIKIKFRVSTIGRENHFKKYVFHCVIKLNMCLQNQISCWIQRKNDEKRFYVVACLRSCWSTCWGRWCCEFSNFFVLWTWSAVTKICFLITTVNMFSSLCQQSSQQINGGKTVLCHHSDIEMCDRHWTVSLFWKRRLFKWSGGQKQETLESIRVWLFFCARSLFCLLNFWFRMIPFNFFQFLTYFHVMFHKCSKKKERSIHDESSCHQGHCSCFSNESVIGIFLNITWLSNKVIMSVGLR